MGPIDGCSSMRDSCWTTTLWGPVVERTKELEMLQLFYRESGSPSGTLSPGTAPWRYIVKLLILSDIHGNWPALEAVLRAEGSWDAVAFCGDAVDYGPHPVECVRWLAEHTDYGVRGNHDNALALGVDCHCLESFRDLSQATAAWHANLLDEFDRLFLAQLPTIECFQPAGLNFRLSHATPQGGLFEYLPMDRWKERVEGLVTDYVLIGHTHVQGMMTFGAVTVINPGSVGLAQDVPGEACYAVCDSGRMRLESVPYDVIRTVTDLRRAPIPRRVIEGF